MGSRAVVIPARHHTATARYLVLGHGRVAHGMERKRGRDERSNPAAPRLAGQSAA